MSVAGSPIEAVLTLNATGFHSGLSEVQKSVEGFGSALNSQGKNFNAILTLMRDLDTEFDDVSVSLSKFEGQAKNVESFNSFANGVKALATAIETLGTDSENTAKGIETIKSVVSSMGESFGNPTIEVRGLASALRELNQLEKQQEAELKNVATATEQYSLGATNVARATDSMSNATKIGRQNLALYHQNLKALALGVEQFNAIETSEVSSINRVTSATEKAIAVSEEYRVLKLKTQEMIERNTQAVIRNSEAMQQNAVSILRDMGYTGELTAETQREIVAKEKQTNATDRATASQNRMATATSRLSKALSSLKMVGSLVASMMVWNFAHNLITATRETVNAKSEMEGYFKMLHFSQGEVDDFNKSLTETVQQFQRVNKYALGETISSIGVEFNLTTEEMKKAMKVTSMVTSEYLRAGRNANEASLAVKDVLQGQFQRLSRETGVKGEQLKEAGWSGDTNDVLGLMEALEKVGESRNWDVFAEKANSLNDIVTILQNRFGEWSAEMVNVVQPSIINAFNSIMSFSDGLSQSLTGLWQWLNIDGWTQTATKIGLVTTSIFALVHSFTAYRTGTSLIGVANLGLTKSLAGLVLGIKKEEMANISASKSIAYRIMGINGEKIAEVGLTNAINQAVFSKGLYKTTTEAQTLASELNEGVLVGEATAIKLVKDEETGAIILKQGLTVATGETTASTVGFTGALGMMIAGEQLAEGQTLSLAGSLGALTGAFLMSPIGWFTMAILGLAGAFYVLTGGLDDGWSKMQSFNEMVKDTDATMQPYYDHLAKIKTALDEAKESYGENSLVVQQLQKRYDDASWSVANFNKHLNEAKYIKDNATQTYEEIGASIDELTTTTLKNEGWSEKQLEDLDNLAYGSNKYYKALQVMHKQVGDPLSGDIGGSNFERDLKAYSESLRRAGIEGEEATQKINEFKETYGELAKTSYEANTAEDWWSWAWASLYAGINQAKLDFENFVAERQAWLNEGEIFKFLFGDEGTENIASEWAKSVSDSFVNAISNIDKWITDSLNSLGEIDILGAIWDAILPSGVSASDGSSDHPSFMEDVSNILGFNVQTWINNFNSDPLGTLGIEIPNIDILGLIQSLLPSGDSGGFDIGGWLNSLFDLSGLVSSFISNLNTILSTASSISSTVGNIFSGLKSTVYSHIMGIVNYVSTGFENARSYATSKITAMRDSVSNVINQMIGAWSHMKDKILESARLIYDGVKKKFDDVGNTLKDFFGKLQDPSKWGAGMQSYSRTPRPATARRLFSGAGVSPHRKSGAGINPYRSPNQKVKLEELVNILGGSKEVTLSDFLSMFSEGGFGGWSFHEPYKTHIFNEGKQWKTGNPTIKGIGTISSSFKTERFWNGRPSFTFDEFLTVAEAIFSQIPYKFYYDSDWKGNWVSALLSGATNCSDGSDALIALASVFGFSGSKIHTTTKDGTGHFYARIGGRNLDTTHFQNGGSWTPLGGAGVSPRGAGAYQPKTYNFDFTGATFYGMDDFKEQVKDATREAMREEFNDPYSVAI